MGQEEMGTKGEWEKQRRSQTNVADEDTIDLMSTNPFWKAPISQNGSCGLAVPSAKMDFPDCLPRAGKALIFYEETPIGPTLPKSAGRNRTGGAFGIGLHVLHRVTWKVFECEIAPSHVIIHGKTDLALMHMYKGYQGGSPHLSPR